jgi:hypothetical protein
MGREADSAAGFPAHDDNARRDGHLRRQRAERGKAATYYDPGQAAVFETRYVTAPSSV